MSYLWRVRIDEKTLDRADQVTARLGTSTQDIEHHRLERRAGRYEPGIVAAIRKRIGWMIEI